MNRNFIKIVFSLSFLFSIFTMAYSQDNDFTKPDIQNRMNQRLQDIIELKDKGIIGENDNGYLERVRPFKRTQNIVDAQDVNRENTDEDNNIEELIRKENADRKEAYQMIAQRTNSTVQIVAEKRAEQLKGNATPGHYIKVNGTWVRKK